MNNNINELRNEMEEKLEYWGISASISLLRCIRSSNNQEELDRLCDSYFIENWMECNRDIEDYELVGRYDLENINEYHIGNGINCYEYKGKRFKTFEDAEEYKEELE